MPTLPSNRDYTDKDYDALRARVLSLITSVFPTWTNLQKANFGVVIVELFAWVMDYLSFYQDQQAREGRMQTLVLRKSMISLAKLIGYELPGATAASADVVVTITNASALTGTVTAASGSPVVVATEAVTNPVRGELISPLPFSILVIDGSKEFVWENSLTQNPSIFSSSGLADQKFLLPFNPFLDDGSEVVSTVAQGTFTRVDSFYSSGPSDLHYRIQIDQNDRAEIIFGDGVLGEIPTGAITSAYRTGGGIAGNVEAGNIKKVEGSFVDSVGNIAYLVASNAADAEGGWPREEVDGAKINAPASLTVLNRTVAREDYEINARRVSTVGRALMLTSNEEAGIGENTGDLYIVPTTGGTASQGILDAVETMVTVTYPHTVTFQVNVKSASYLTVHIRAVIFLHQNTTPSVVKAAVVTALTDYFAPMLSSGAPNTEIDFGYNYKDDEGEPAGEIAWSDVQDVVQSTEGVRKVDPGTDGFTLNGLRSDLSLPNWRFPELGDVTVINGATDTEI